MSDNIYEPLKEYKNKYKDLHYQNVTEFFKELVLKSGINEGENLETVKKINKTIALKENTNKQIKSRQTLRILLITLAVVLALLSFYFLSKIPTTDQVLLNLLLGIVSIALVVLLLFIVFKKINPFLKLIISKRDELTSIINTLISEAEKQMAPLNSLFNNQQHIMLFKKTIPLINLDNSFDIKRYEYLVKNFGLDTTVNNNRSTLFVKSGDIKGNPFYIANDLIHELGTKTYTGSIVITYRTYTVVNGKRVATTNTQTLTATVTKPFPYYKEQSYILYGNQAAPNLSFSRQDSDAEIMSQKQIDKQVTKIERKLHKKARKSVNKGGDFTVMAHSEFEVLWHAIDRDNEVQFRLLFTPLAQKQLLELMKDKEIGYGDNFDFYKNKMINIIIPEHLKMFNLDISDNYYRHYDFKKIEEKFINYNTEFFKKIYFGFAPVLAIPLYQQHQPHEYIYKDLYDGYVSFYEHEMIVNKMPKHSFYHPESDTHNILKTSLIKSENNKDIIVVTAYGYKTINRVDYISKMGMDGKLHSIPVHWQEFIPVNRASNLEVNIVSDEKEETVRTKIEDLVKKIQNKENLSNKELAVIGRYITRIIK